MSITQLVQEILQQIPIHPLSHSSLIHFNQYIDNYLKFYVVQMNFDFFKIAKALRQAFPDQACLLTKQKIQCRWNQYHRFRLQGIQEKELLLKDRKAKAVMALQDPRKLMTTSQLIQDLKRKQQSKQKKCIQPLPQPKNNCFNVLTDSVRMFKPEQYKKVQAQFLQNLKKTIQNQPAEADQPLIFKPKFSSFTQFDVQKQKLTQQMAARILANRVKLPQQWTQIQQEQLQQQSLKQQIKRKIPDVQSKMKGYRNFYDSQQQQSESQQSDN